MTQAPTMPLHMRRDRFAPVDELRELREGDGVRRFETPFGANVWIATRYADVREVLGDADRFSNRMAFRPPTDPRSEDEREKARAGQLLALDPPEHTRLRRLLRPEFTVRRMQRLEPRIVEIVDEHLDAMESAGSPTDLVQEFALPIPSLVICELLGVPYADRAEFQARTARQLDLSIAIEERMELGRAGRAYMEALVARTKLDPGEDMLGMLVREHAGEITDDELVGIGNLLLIAGHETTSNMLALVRDDPAAAGLAVEELLRWLTIVHSGVVRTATVDAEIAGHTVAAGDLVVCSLPTANRDSALLADPERLDVTRGAPGHLAFGHGVHHCLGAALARLEGRIALGSLLARVPDLCIAVPVADLRLRASVLMHGFAAVPVAVNRARP